MRWMMCPKCGIKLITIQDDFELVIRECPVEKDWYMSFSGKLLKKLERLSELRNESIKELIERAINKGWKELEMENVS